LNFQSGYYRQITLTKTGKTLLLQLDRVLGPTQVVVTETLPTNVTGEVSADPVQFVYDYYSAVNRRQYELTWSLLSDDYKNRNNGPDKGGYQGYVDFWNRISSVEVKTAYLVAQDASFAKVKAIIHYNLVQVGTEEYEITFHMVHSAVGSSWLIDATPTQKIGQ